MEYLGLNETLEKFAKTPDLNIERENLKILLVDKSGVLRNAETEGILMNPNPLLKNRTILNTKITKDGAHLFLAPEKINTKEAGFFDTVEHLLTGGTSKSQSVHNTVKSVKETVSDTAKETLGGAKQLYEDYSKIRDTTIGGFDKAKDIAGKATNFTKNYYPHIAGGAALAFGGYHLTKRYLGNLRATKAQIRLGENVYSGASKKITEDISKPITESLSSVNHSINNLPEAFGNIANKSFNKNFSKLGLGATALGLGVATPMLFRENDK